MLEKVYQVALDKPLLVTYDKKKGTVTYYDEHKQLVTESHGSFAWKIANNIQNCYLKGMTHLTLSGLEHKVNPNKSLDTYDFRVWNDHIYQLFDEKYRKKLVNHLESFTLKQKILLVDIQYEKLYM